MKKLILTTITFLLFLLNAVSQNDDCASAIALSVNEDCVAEIFDNTGFSPSEEGDEQFCGAAGEGIDLWFTATVPQSGNLVLSTVQVGGGLSDMVMWAYTGSCGALEILDCDDDAGSNAHSQLVLTNRTPGETIYIRIFEFSSDEFGEFGICAFSPVIGSEDFTNDVCSDAVLITPEHDCSPRIFTNVGATNSGDGSDFSCGSEGVGNDTWFETIVPESGSLTIEVTATVVDGFGDSVLQAYSGSCDSLEFIECDDDGAGNLLLSRIDLAGRTPGESIYFEVIEFASDFEGSFGICVYDESISDVHNISDVSINIYPNPTSRFVQIENNDNLDLEYYIYDMTGQLVQTEKNQDQIDLGNLNDGLYLLKAIDTENNEHIVERITLQR
jgi:hypothetical protein